MDAVGALTYYGSIGLSERNIKTMMGLSLDQWDRMMGCTPDNDTRTCAQIYRMAKAHWELKRVELTEDMLDDPNTPINLKAKILRDDLRTMAEHSPANANASNDAATNVFTGYDIQVIRKEDPTLADDDTEE